MPTGRSADETSTPAQTKAHHETKAAPAKATDRRTTRSAKAATASKGPGPVTEAKKRTHRTPHDARASQPKPASITLNLPLDQVVTAATAVVRLPLNAARKVAPTRVNGMKGVPVYLGIGGLAVAGLVEWPVAAAAGAGYAALRRWGPLKPDQGA